MHNKSKNRYILSITLVATIGGLLFGYDTGVIGGSQLFFTEYFHFNEYQQGWAVSSALIGCFIGAAAAGIISSKFSRKNALILSAILFSISAWGSGIPESLTTLVIFRIIGGLGVGIASMNAPMYIAEIAPPEERGKLVSYYQLAVVIGFFVVFLVTYLVGGGDVSTLSEAEKTAIHDYNVDQGWRVMFWSELVPAISFLILLFFVPHSPRWLALKERYDEAFLVIKKVTDTEEDAQKELNEIKDSLNKNKEVEESSLSILLGKKFGLMLFIGIMLSVFQQVTGINAILYYGAEIFSNALGYGPEDSLKQQLLLGAVNLIFTFVAIFTVDKWGRKPLLILGTIGMLVGISTLGLTIYTDNKGILSLIGVLTFIASFALSMGPIVWVMLSEIFPNKVRSAAMSIAVAAQWLSNTLVAFTFPIIVNSAINNSIFNGALPYFIFGAFCIITILFAWKLVPETKGMSLEEMETLWENNNDKDIVSKEETLTV